MRLLREGAYSMIGRPNVSPQWLLKVACLYSVRSETHTC